jgi:ParB-like nuclease domain
MSRYRVVDPMNITPLHEIRAERMGHLRQLITRMKQEGWVGRPVVVEETDRNRYQAWSATHRLAAARRLRLWVPILLINKERWIHRWGVPKNLFVDEVGTDEDKYAALNAAGDKLAAEVVRREIELNMSGDNQRSLVGRTMQSCL